MDMPERNMVNLTITMTREESMALKQLALDKDIPVDISLILGNLITVIVDYQIPHKPLKILSL